MKTASTILLLFALLLALTACGRRNEKIYQDSHRDAISAGHVSLTSPQTLSIFTYNWNAHFLRYAADMMAARWQEQGREFDVEIETYTWRQRESRMTRLRVQMMAGQAPDIIMLNPNPWVSETSVRNFFTSGMFADFYTLIDNDPNTSRDDFFTNVLESWEYDGRLYTFPIAFSFEYVGINASLPQHIINKFAEFDTISMHELLRLYLYLKEDYHDEFGHLSIFSHHQLTMPFHVLSHSMSGFIDYTNKSSYLNTLGFVTLLEDWQQIFYVRGLFDFDDSVRQFGWSHLDPRPTVGRHLPIYSGRYVFAVESGSQGPVNALVANSNPYFLHYIPITDEQGRLRIGHTSFGSWWSPNNNRPCGRYWRAEGSGHLLLPAITASADSQLAWEYVQQLISAFVYLQEHDSGCDFPIYRTITTPIRRDYFMPQAFDALEYGLGDFMRAGRPDITFPTQQEQTQALEAAVARLARYSEMPVSPPFLVPSGLFANVLDTYLRLPLGTVFGAQETAQELHNRVSLWLIE